jgi:hypothetical protein
MARLVAVQHSVSAAAGPFKFEPIGSVGGLGAAGTCWNMLADAVMLARWLQTRGTYQHFRACCTLKRSFTARDFKQRLIPLFCDSWRYWALTSFEIQLY